MNALAEEVLGALDSLVLLRLSDGRFALCGVVPPWCHELRPGACDAAHSVAVEEVFPFLDSFLHESEEAWRGEGPARVDSEFWTEVTPSGREVHLKAAALSIGSSDVLVVTRDDSTFVSHQLLLQRAREIHLAHAALAREVEQRDVLVHCIVHDLATPLHSVLATLSLLNERPTRRSSEELIELALEAAKRQRELIRTILDVFSAEQGALSADLEAASARADVAHAMSHVAAELEPVARRRNVHLALDPPSLPEGALWVVGDDTRLFRVLANLVENALRYSPQDGTVRINCRPEASTVLVSVEDEGPGVPPDLAPQIFQKFVKRNGTRGTGLGLYFCRITVERWGGSVGYEPRPGGGSRFWVRLPRR